MVSLKSSVHLRLTAPEAVRLRKAMFFALSFLQEFALEENRDEFEAIMAFVGRLEIAIEAVAARGPGERE